MNSPGVERLDYPIAISGVPRLVSGAGAGDPPVPCLLITQSSPFQTVTLAVTGDVVVAKLSGRPSILRHSLVAVRFLPARGSYSACNFPSKSVALPTELPGQGAPIQ